MIHCYKGIKVHGLKGSRSRLHDGVGLQGPRKGKGRLSLLPNLVLIFGGRLLGKRMVTFSGVAVFK